MRVAAAPAGRTPRRLAAAILTLTLCAAPVTGTSNPGSGAVPAPQAASRPTSPPTGNWPQFRGPGAGGVADGADLPDTFNGIDRTNLAWSAEIPGLAHASPIVWGDRVYVTTAVGEGPPQRYLAELPDGRASVIDTAPHRWLVLALDRSTGELVWERTVAEGVPRSGRLQKGSFNNSTPATDGTHVVALFGSQGLFCYDADGNLLWQVDLGPLDAGWFFDPTVQWGTAASPVIHDGRVIVQADVFGGAFLAAFDVADGHELWRTPRDEVSSWATPTVVATPERTEIVTNGGRAIRAYDAATGAELWRLAPSSEIAVPTPILAGELIFVGSGYLLTQPFYAVRPGGSGDISPAAAPPSGGPIAWSVTDRGPLISTPIVVGDYLFLLSRDGMLACFDAVTGLPMYRESIVADATEPAAGGAEVPGSAAAPGGTAAQGNAIQEAHPPTFSASPVAAGGKLYIAGEDGNVYVVGAGPFLRLVAANLVGEPVFATPAISDGMLLVRGLRHLYVFSRRP